MANQPAQVQLSVVPDAQTQKEIENTIDAPRLLAEAIEDFKKKRTDAETELAQSLAKDLSAAPLNVDSAIEKCKAWKAEDEALGAKMKSAEELLSIIERRIEELKASQPESLKAVIQRKIEQLQKEAAEEKQNAQLLQKQIDVLKALLTDLEKTGSQKKGGG